MSQTTSVHKPRGRWDTGDQRLLFHMEHREPRHPPPRLRSLSKGLPPSLGGGRALAHWLQLATGDAAGFFSPLGCTKKGKLIPSHHGLENPTGSFDFKLLLNGARVQLLTLAEGSKCVCRREFAASSLPGIVQPACSRARTACLGTNPLLWHGQSLLNLSEAGETPEMVKFGTAARREHSPTPDVRMCTHTQPHYLSKADTSLSEVTQATKGTSPPPPPVPIY